MSRITRVISIGMILLMLLSSFTMIPPVRASGLPSGVKTYYWAQDDEIPVPMMSVDKAVCVLQGVAGSFRGGGEGVWIRNFKGRWYLGGKSQQQGVAAGALCVPFSLIRSKFSYWESPWTLGGTNGTCSGFPLSACSYQPVRWKDMSNLNGFCYITGMSGQFNGGGERIWIETNFNTSKLTLRVTSGVEGGYIHGEANCIERDRTLLMSGDYQWDQNWPNANQTIVALIPAQKGFCGLTEIRGEFQGSGESVYIEANDDGIYYLKGRSQQDDVRATARCMYYNQG